MSAQAMRGAWINGNPEPKVHAFGSVVESPRRRVVLAMCRVTVREQLGEVFYPDDPKACPDCAEFVRDDLTVEQAHERVTERTRERMNDPSTIVCRRGGPR